MFWRQRKFRPCSTLSIVTHFRRAMPQGVVSSQFLWIPLHEESCSFSYRCEVTACLPQHPPPPPPGVCWRKCSPLRTAVWACSWLEITAAVNCSRTSGVQHLYLTSVIMLLAWNRPRLSSQPMPFHRSDRLLIAWRLQLLHAKTQVLRCGGV
jgi:hypothetical protein